MHSIETIRQLTDAGFTPSQANLLAERMTVTVHETAATRDDIAKLAASTREDMAKLAASTREDMAKLAALIEKLDTKFSGAIDRLDTKLTGAVDRLDAKLTGELDTLDTKYTGAIDRLDTKLSGAIDRLDTKFGGELKAGLAETKNTILTWFVGTAIAFAGLTYSMTRPAPLSAQPPAATQQPAQPNNQKP